MAATKTKKRRIERTLTANGCSVSAFSVHPANWNEAGADPSLTWYIFYRFYDPAFPQPKLVIAKGGINSFNTLGARRHLTQMILADERKRIIEACYNPITEQYMQQAAPALPASLRSEPILPEDGLWRGIIFARTKHDAAYRPETRKDVDSYLRRLMEAARRINLHTKPLGEFRRRDLLAILDNMAEQKAWSPYTWNNLLGYLLPLFGILNTYEAMEINPCDGIKKLPVPKKLRVTLTMAERRIISRHLRDFHRRFWLFVQIFFHSGAREIELLGLRSEDVDLEGQRFWVTSYKGKDKTPQRVQKTIKDVALPYWQEYLFDAPAGEYLFCRGWLPGARPLTRGWVTHLWEAIVKDGLGIDVDLYSLKHLHYDETDELLGTHAAAAQAGHTSTAMSKHYAVTQQERKLQKVKKLPNVFA